MQKAQLLLAPVLALAFASSANAALYETICNSCSPFGPASPAVLNAAITVAQQNSAVVGDSVEVCKNTNAGKAAVMTYDVNSAPVTSSSNLTPNPDYVILDNGPC